MVFLLFATIQNKDALICTELHRELPCSALKLRVLPQYHYEPQAVASQCGAGSLISSASEPESLELKSAQTRSPRGPRSFRVHPKSQAGLSCRRGRSTVTEAARLQVPSPPPGMQPECHRESVTDVLPLNPERSELQHELVTDLGPPRRAGFHQ